MLFYIKPLKNTFTIQNKDKKEESKVLFYFLILDEVLLMDAICLAPTFGLNHSGVLDRGAKQLLKPAAAAAAATNAMPVVPVVVQHCEISFQYSKSA